MRLVMVNPFSYFAKKSHIEDFFLFERFLLQLVAMWPWDSKKSFWGLRLAARFFEMFMLLLCSHMIVLQSKAVIENWSDGLDRVTVGLVLILIYSFCFFSTVYFILNPNKLHKVVKVMNSCFRQRSAKGLTYVRAMDSYERTRKFAKVWTISCFLAVMLWGIYPILAHEHVLPIECWYPFDEKQHVVYEFLYFIQMLAQAQIGQAFGNGSGVYVVFLTLICGQYDILFCSLKNVLHTAEIHNGIESDSRRNKQYPTDSENEEINQYYCSKEIQEELPNTFLRTGRKSSQDAIRDALIDCVRHHQGILKVCAALEDFYNPFCLIKSLQMTVQLCFLVFVSVNTTNSLMKSVNLAQYLLMTLCELLIFTYLGQVLKTQSVQVADALFRCDWYRLDPTIRKDVLIFLPNALRTIEMTSAKFSGMDTERLRAVLTQAFSFFTLLQSLA